MHDIKKHLIRSLLISQSMMAEEIPEKEIGYFTYFTNFGVIVGKKVDVESLPSESSEMLYSELKQRKERKETVSLYQIADANLGIMLRNTEEIAYSPGNMDTKAIILEDVTIKSIDNEVYKVTTFVLFTDQVIGLVPWKLNQN
ncbi:hypothetical protein [Sporosarcina sp. OR05]|uniref:hypothetical protein n=1 Tax=Sporosarcina sp. OR05 TaxID=2969819 RepID=UPI00352A2748